VRSTSAPLHPRASTSTGYFLPFLTAHAPVRTIKGRPILQTLTLYCCRTAPADACVFVGTGRTSCLGRCSRTCSEFCRKLRYRRFVLSSPGSTCTISGTHSCQEASSTTQRGCWSHTGTRPLLRSWSRSCYRSRCRAGLSRWSFPLAQIAARSQRAPSRKARATLLVGARTPGGKEVTSNSCSHCACICNMSGGKRTAPALLVCPPCSGRRTGSHGHALRARVFHTSAGAAGLSRECPYWFVTEISSAGKRDF